ncbi:anaerobic sulfatase maturase [Bacillus sp. BRMEA1]|uniref:anaerobic sulfatase maturase n=1 Tax=Neobacillus endophyticus TaxID=2738405 RepID=UPI001567C212|nr:anaerobic sulfatase maturase [Neobacillus endophyticus]NRD76825.1 anaerobic sulfatase maturase [Neobacillus endophyticus]
MKGRNSLGKSHHFHLLAKPTGPMCNLDCEYCFYTKKESNYPKNHSFRLPDDVLEMYIQQYIASQDTEEVVFAWQGGEPTLMGLDFFIKAVSLQKKYAGGKQIKNTIQTNGTLLTDRWCEFLSAHHFLVGLSLDGPEAIHNQYRFDRGGKPTFHEVMRGLSLLKKHHVEYNVLTCVTRHSAYKPLEIYHFFKQQGIQYIQLIPVVEREECRFDVSPWTVESEMYGEFLISIFDEWVREDIGSVFVMNFEWALAAWAGIPSSICLFAEECGRALVMEHNGDLFSCDHYVSPEYRLGNIKDGLMEAADQRFQRDFGRKKRSTLPRVCQNCEFRFACHGECPKNRFLVSEEKEQGLNYLCASYKNFFKHISPYMKVMKQLLQAGLPVSLMKDILIKHGKTC